MQFFPSRFPDEKKKKINSFELEKKRESNFLKMENGSLIIQFIFFSLSTTATLTNWKERKKKVEGGGGGKRNAKTNFPDFLPGPPSPTPSF